jgi:hypothetical protein
MLAHSFRAPKQDGAVLAVPPLADGVSLLKANQSRLASWDYDFQGRSYSALREKARADVFEAAARYHAEAGLDLPPAYQGGAVVVTGHQPELFHAGVWVKNFAVAGLARSAGTTGLNFVVDNDIPKGAYIRVPDLVSGSLKSRPVLFDDWKSEAPFEDQSIENQAQFAGFPSQVHAMLGRQVADPLIDHFWTHVNSAPAEISVIGRRFARARRLIEAEWGVRNWEVPLSSICETDGFRWFATHLLAHLPRFQGIHNDALTRYRKLYGIRSKNHPVADLGREDDWLESPFWVWRKREARRRPLMARQLAKVLQLRIGGESAPFLELPLTIDTEGCCGVEAMQTLPDQGIRLRTRALTTTMFARFLVGDLFIHGIGGAKYDELGDEISRGFFGIEPPEFLTLSMTLHLGLPTTTATIDDLRRVDRRIRDVRWQPEGTIESGGEVSDLIAKKRALIASEPSHHFERKARYVALRQVNDNLAARLADRIPSLRAERAVLVESLRNDSVARSREYSLVLHNSVRIHDAMTRVFQVNQG